MISKRMMRKVEKKRGTMDSMGKRVLITKEGLWCKSREKQAMPCLLGKY